MMIFFHFILALALANEISKGEENNELVIRADNSTSEDFSSFFESSLTDIGEITSSEIPVVEESSVFVPETTSDTPLDTPILLPETTPSPDIDETTLAEDPVNDPLTTSDLTTEATTEVNDPAITDPPSPDTIAAVSTEVQNGSTVVVTRTSLVPQQQTSQPEPQNNSSGLSQTNKIVVGVVVGVGGAILFGILALFFFVKYRKNDEYESGKWTFWRKQEKVGSDEFLSGELGVRDRNINQGSNF